MNHQTQARTNIGNRWGVVLKTLYSAARYLSIEDLAKLSSQDEGAVKTALEFLRGQGWADQLADGPEWVCTPAARAVMDSLSKSKVFEQ